uniref:Uncharacterized protein n=1 Tax=Glossina palpalis gambiensis TaxID=67801 RepID=A0A1B0B4G7_9MUSC
YNPIVHNFFVATFQFCWVTFLLFYFSSFLLSSILVNVNLIGIATFSLSQNPLLSTKIRTVPATKIRVHSTLLTCHLIIEEYMFYVIPYIYTQISLAGETRRADFCNFLRFRQLPGNYFPVVGGARRLQSLGMTQIMCDTYYIEKKNGMKLSECGVVSRAFF